MNISPSTTLSLVKSAKLIVHLLMRRFSTSTVPYNIEKSIHELLIAYVKFKKLSLLENTEEMYINDVELREPQLLQYMYIEKLEIWAARLQEIIEYTKKHEHKMEFLDFLLDGWNGGVDDILIANKKFVNEIDNFMQTSSNYRSDNIEIIATIVLTCPEFLATCTSLGYLPIHRPRDFETAFQYIQLFAKIGVRHEIGGKFARGGILVYPRNDSRAGNLLQQLAKYNDSIDIFEQMRKANPPLFFVEDIQNFKLVHSAVLGKNIEVIKYLTELDPSSLYDTGETWSMPIRYICPQVVGDIYNEDKRDRLDVAQYLIKRAIIHDRSHWSIGGLFSERKR